MNLLIVDDTPTDLKLLRAQLEAEGHAVFEAHDGVDALALLERQRVDGVISDILMPRMDGYRLCYEIRKHARLHDLPIIIYTFTFTSPSDEKLALDVGADKYLKKPASVETIITALHEVLAMPHPAPRPEALPEIEVLKEYSERLVFKLEEKNTELMAAEVKFRTLVEQSIVGIYIIQDDQFVYVNPRMAEIFGRSEEEMTSRTLYDFIVPEDHALRRENIRKQISGEAPSLHYYLRMLQQSGAVLQVEVHSSRADYNGRPAVMGTLLDITERRRAEEALAARADQQAVVVELGWLALAGADLQQLFDQGMTRVAETFGTEYCKVLELLPDGSALKLVAGVGWKEGLVGQATVDADRNSQAGFTLLSRHPVIVEDLRTETRFNGPPLLRDHGIVSGLSVIIGEVEEPFGVMGAHTTRRRVFTSDDVNFFQSVAHVLAEAIQRKRAEEALRESEARTQLLIKSSNIGLWDWNLVTNEMFFSPEGKSQLGYADDELPNHYDEWASRLHPEDREATLRAVQDFRESRRKVYDLHFRLRHKDGSWRWILVRADLIHDAAGQPVRMMGCQIDITKRKQAEAELEHSAHLLQLLSRRLFHVQEDEKRHLARELHDEMGQALTAVKINLQSAQRLDDPADLARRLDESIGILDRLLQQTRRLSFDLRPPLLDDLGLVPALRSYLDEQAQRAGFGAIFFADPRLERLSPEIETACFRVAQQALTNTVRHAEARTVNVELHLAPHALHLIVRDDGVGFDVEAAEERARRGGSLGLPAMRERLLLVGGELDCKSTPGQGTEVHAFLPLEIDSHVFGLLS